MVRSTPLRLLYSFPHPLGRPGIGTTAINQVRALSELGVEVTVVCTSLHGSLPPEVKVVETLRLAGRRVPHRALGNPDRALAYHDLRVAGFLRRHREDFDAVHTWPQSAIRTLRAASAVGCLGSREVPNTHTANAYEQAEVESRITGVGLREGHSHRSDPRRLALEDAEYAAADLLLVPSTHVADTFIRRGVPVEKVQRHQYGYDPARFSPTGRNDHPGRPFTAAFVGSAEPRKGLHYALQAWTRAEFPARGARLDVAGGFVPGYREYVSRWLDEAPSIRCLGFVDDVPALLRESDVLVLPSVEEGSALVTYEAQASGCIPVVSDATGALVPPSVAPYVHPARDVAALTEHLSRIASDDSLRARLRADVIAWSAGLSWRAAAARMQAIYGAALTEVNRPPRR